MFELAWPWVLWAWPLPFLLWWLLPPMLPYRPAALRVPFFEALESNIRSERYGSARKIATMGIIWSLVLCALAGPRWVGAPQPLVREGYNILLALDISGSMEMRDMSWHGQPATRLAVVKRAAAQFVQDRVGDKIGLILFGSQAYLQTPLTYDRHNVLMRIEDATVGLAGKTTSIGDALGLAVKRLQSVPSEGRIIILLTDGANNSGVLAPLKAAELARDDGIKVYTIGLGSNAAMGGLFLNMNMASDLDEDTLKAVSKITGGRYFRATDGASLQNIYQSINRMEKVSQEKATVHPEHDYYPWLLSLALLLLFLSFWQEMGSPWIGARRGAS